jgi:hypothetical protein
VVLALPQANEKTFGQSTKKLILMWAITACLKWVNFPLKQLLNFLKMFVIFNLDLIYID